MNGHEEKNLLDRITVEKGKCAGSPCVRGMRMKVSHVLSYLASGMSEAEILEEFPFLEVEDIKACLFYASVQLEKSAEVA